MSEIPRQIFRQNGEPIEGQGASPEEARNEGLLVGVVRAWLIRQREGRIEVLAQKRASTKRTFPSAYDLAVGGHVDKGETQVEAIVREAQEELGIEISPEKLCLLAMFRFNKDVDDQTVIRNLVWTYSYQLNGDEEVTTDPEEVETADWLPLDECAELAREGKVTVPANLILPTVEAIKAQHSQISS